MMRLTSVLRLARTNIISLSSATTGMKPATVVGPRGRVPAVEFPTATCPLAATVETMDGRTVLVADAVQQMAQVLTRACTAKNIDRGVVSAPSLGYKARILVVQCGIERRALINPVIKLLSKQTIHAWAEEGSDVYRVVRHRSIAVKYTTVDGDDETWYAMPLEESEAVQRQLDLFDGFGVEDRVAPLGVGAASAFAADTDAGVKQMATHGVVPRDLFKANEGLLMRLVEKVPRKALAENASASA